ncbi:MAG: hypothetical protein ACLFVQ_07820 [Chitinispirillaceae bacterium]
MLQVRYDYSFSKTIFYEPIPCTFFDISIAPCSGSVEGLGIKKGKLQLQTAEVYNRFLNERREEMKVPLFPPVHQHVA